MRKIGLIFAGNGVLMEKSVEHKNWIIFDSLFQILDRVCITFANSL
jgi:hypothetical protein